MKKAEIKCKHCSTEKIIDLGPGFTTEIKVYLNEEGEKSFVLWHHLEGIHVEKEEKNEKYLAEGWIEIVGEEELKRYLPQIKCEVCEKIGFEYTDEEI